MACYYPFLAVYLMNRRLTYVQIGIIFAVQSLVGIIAQPLWGYITDKYLSKKKAVIINLLACSLVIFLFIPANSFLAIAAAVVALVAFQCAITPISDSYCYEIVEKNPKMQFGKIRLLGSVSFALVALILGKAIDYWGINISFWVYSFFMLCTLYFFFGIKHNEGSTVGRPGFGDLVSVMKNYRFTLFVVSVMLLSIMQGAHGGYIPMLIEKTGGSVSTIGIVWFAQAMSELPIFFLGNRIIKRFGELNIYLLAVALYAVRMFLSSISGDYVTVIAVQLMQGITYPFYILSVIQYVNKEVPDKIKASGMSIMSSLGFGLGGFIGSIMGGSIIEGYDVFVLYKAITIVCIAAFGVGMLLKIKDSKNKTFPSL